MRPLGYHITIHGGNSLHAFYCDKCNKRVYNVSKLATNCKCEVKSNGLNGTQTESSGTEIASNAEGSLGSGGGIAAGNDGPDAVAGNGDSSS